MEGEQLPYCSYYTAEEMNTENPNQKKLDASLDMYMEWPLMHDRMLGLFFKSTWNEPKHTDSETTYQNTRNSILKGIRKDLPHFDSAELEDALRRYLEA